MGTAEIKMLYNNGKAITYPVDGRKVFPKHDLMKGLDAYWDFEDSDVKKASASFPGDGTMTGFMGLRTVASTLATSSTVARKISPCQFGCPLLGLTTGHGQKAGAGELMSMATAFSTTGRGHISASRSGTT